MSIEYTDYFGDNEIENVVEEPCLEEHPTLMGIIYNTEKVYMRKEADKESPHVSILDKDEEVMIDGVEEDAIGTRWYHLITASGNEGYTMADYVKIVE